MKDVKNETSTPVDSAVRAWATFSKTLVELGTSWAAYGLKVGKMALVTSAETLGRLAEAFEALSVEIEKKKSGGAAGVEEVGANGVASGAGTPAG